MYRNSSAGPRGMSGCEARASANIVRSSSVGIRFDNSFCRKIQYSFLIYYYCYFFFKDQDLLNNAGSNIPV